MLPEHEDYMVAIVLTFLPWTEAFYSLSQNWFALEMSLSC
jgi:predicted small integral membrane protein